MPFSKSASAIFSRSLAAVHALGSGAQASPPLVLPPLLEVPAFELEVPAVALPPLEVPASLLVCPPLELPPLLLPACGWLGVSPLPFDGPSEDGSWLSAPHALHSARSPPKPSNLEIVRVCMAFSSAFSSCFGYHHNVATSATMSSSLGGKLV
jgi:hypothetical protein